MIARAGRLFAHSTSEGAADSRMPPSWSRGSDPGAWHLGIPVAAACLLLVSLLAVTMPHQPALVGAGGMLVLIAVLGYATYCALPGPPRDPAVCAFLSACYGVVVLILIGLADNTVLPHLGVRHPLQQKPVLLTVELVFLGLCRIGHARWEFMRDFTVQRVRALPSYVNVRPALLLLLPAAAASGAVALDNGRGSAVTVMMLVACLAVFGYLLWRGQRLSRATILFSIYLVALALLLMTSLRGRYTTGHDVQHEYYVFQLAKAHWHWDISQFRDPYNACLSITILPVMLAGIFHVSDVMVFKLLFQLIFALVPVGVYLISERLAGRRPAILATLVFLSFPTYFSDMPMLNRQEIAMFLLTGMMLLFIDRWPGVRRIQQAPFLLLGLGVVLSHYSTSYLMVGQFGIAVLLLATRRLPQLLRRLLSLNPEGRHRFGHISQVRLITVPVVLILAFFAFLWQSPLTHTGGNVTQIAGQVVKSVTGAENFDSRSGDLSASFFNGNVDPSTQVQQYVDAAPQGRVQGLSYYPASVVQKYPLGASTDETAPLTPVGRALNDAGLNTYSLNSALRGGSAKLMQVLVALGLIGLLLRRPRSWGVRWDPEYQMLCIGALGIVGAIVVLPFLSVDYGLLRAFQQTLVVLALPVVMGCAMLGSAVGKTGRNVAAIGLPVVFFISSTGIAASVTGGYLPQLHLSNAGDNYDAYYTQDAEVGIAQWLTRQLPADQRFPKNLQADYIASSRLAALGYPGAGELDISPELTQQNAYVFLSYSNVVLQRAYAEHPSLISYQYPLAFLDQNKNRVADAGVSRVYR
jgi:uncharacterized membrane protein